MKLTTVQNLLVASEKRQPAMLRIDDPDAEFEVQLMVEAGLVEATLRDGRDQSFTAIHRLTNLGRQFLRAFREAPMPAKRLRPGARYAARRQTAENEVLKKWNANFALDFRWPDKAD